MAAKGLFITGTDTDVGKTFVSCQIIREMLQQGKSIGAYKPACSGSVTDSSGKRQWEDIELLHQALQRRESKERICPQTFEWPLAPDRAAKMESRTVDESLLVAGWKWWLERVEYLLIEGVGGLLSPLSENYLVADFAAQTGYPLLVIADAGLGTINHTLLTIEVARQRGLSVAAVLLNQTRLQSDDSVCFNKEDLASRTDVPVLGVMPFCPDRESAHLEGWGGYNWASLFCEPVQSTQDVHQ